LDRLYDSPKSEDPHLFRFEPWDHFKHEEARKKMIQDQKEKVSETESSAAKGLTWMDSDRLGPFQKYNQPSTTNTT